MDSVEDRPELEIPLRAFLVLVLGGTILGGAFDLYMDAPGTWRSAHVIFEVGLITVATLSSVILWHGWWRSRQTLADARRTVASQAAEREAWRESAESALSGFARAVDERFELWHLTPVEREIALCLLKGRSHKQIAFDTGRSERTVRQHAVSIYQKSKLGGRAELAAFFLDDLLLPSSTSIAGEQGRDENHAS